MSWFWISFVLLSLVVYMPVGVLILCLLVPPMESHLMRTNKAEFVKPIVYGLISALFGAAILIHGGLFGWYDTLEAPSDIVMKVDDEVKNDFYKYEEKDGVVYLTVSDKNFSNYTKSHLADNGDIHFEVRNENAKKERAKLKWEIEIDGEKYERDSLPAGTEIHLFSPDFSLKVGESVAKVTAKNDLGEFSKTFVINKVSTETECAKTENAEKNICAQIAAANQADAEEKAKAVKNQGSASNPVYDYTPSTLDGTTDTTNCSYVKYGKCWDNVIEQADNDGAMDAYLNEDAYFGNPNYQGCEGVCADIYEDVYWKSYDNYQMTH